MKQTKRNLLWVSVCICIFFLALTITACDDSHKTKPPQGFGTISGTVTAPNKAPLEGVMVSVGSMNCTTGADGKYVISNIPAESRALIDFVKPNYISTHKVVTIVRNRTVNSDAVMFVAVTMTFPSNDVAIVIDGSASVQVPANAFVDEDGTPFTGNIFAEAKYFDPTDPAALAAFPGEFEGVQTDGSETAFESYGFISASFFDAANPVNELQLGAGKTAHLVTPIPVSLQTNAPATIQMWYYNEDTGKWMEQGVGTKSANGLYYEGDVSHFTYWNFDHSIQVTDQSTLTGLALFADTDSTFSPATGAQVVANGVDYAGYTRAFADAQGHFSITVKASSQVRLQAFSGSNSSFPSEIISTPASNGSATVDTLIISDLSFHISGTMVNAAGEAITGGYGRIMQTNAPAGALPFVSWINPNGEGHFSNSESFAGAGSTITVQFNIMAMNVTLYSNPISFVVPYPGDSFDFGTITMRSGGNIIGRLKDNAGNFLNGGSIYWNQTGGSGASEVFFYAPIDSLGNFHIEGPPSTTITNMVGTVSVGAVTLTTGSRTLTFPASGGTNNMGTINMTVQTKRK